MKVGDRVKLRSDAHEEFKKQSQGYEGKIIYLIHNDEDAWARVIWDNNRTNSYPIKMLIAVKLWHAMPDPDFSLDELELGADLVNGRS